MKIITIYPYLKNRGGAADFALDLARSINEGCKSFVLTNSKEICKDYQFDNVIYLRFSLYNILRLYSRDTIFVSHHRKQTSILVLLNNILLFNRLKILHVAHNTFTNLKWACFFPKNIIAVSNSVKDNLIDYFGLSENKITVILNGKKDRYNPDYKNNYRSIKDDIKIILLGRYNPVKQQVLIVKNTKGKISDHIKIYFAGQGDDEELLRTEIGNDKHYEIIGFIDTCKELYDYDYVLLYSKNEGLPLSLIDGCMFCKPLITNSIKPVLEINRDDYNGFVVSDWDELNDCLNTLPKPNTEKYKTMSLHSRIVFEKKFKFEYMIKKYKEYFLNL